MTPLEQQLELLQKMPGYEAATIEHVAGHPSVVVIPGVELPSGWSKPITTARFALPPGYPFGNPDCFFADCDLRLAGGQMPQNTGIQLIPGRAAQQLWFSWHPKTWNANRDSLQTYMRLINQRFTEVR